MTCGDKTTWIMATPIIPEFVGMVDADGTQKGEWIQERVLGAGSFGTVTLWKNKVCYKINCH